MNIHTKNLFCAFEKIMKIELKMCRETAQTDYDFVSAKKLYLYKVLGHFSWLLQKYPCNYANARKHI